MKPPEIKKPKGEVSTRLPRRSSEQVCYTRPARAQRRIHTPSDLRRIYRYVVGSHGWKDATCAIVEESGIQEYLGEVTELVQSAAPCNESVDLSVILGWLPDDMDEQLGLEPGTIEEGLAGCDADGGGVSTTLRVALGMLLLLWGLWKKVSLTRLYRFILRRFLLTTAIILALDRLGEFLARAIPLVLLIGDSLDKLTEVCSDGSE